MSDSPRAARYSGMRTRRKILAVMALSGGARRPRRREPGRRLPAHARRRPEGPARLRLRLRGHRRRSSLARYNPFAVVLVAFLLGGLQNAGAALQGPDFPSGLVGVMEGMILFTALGGELLVRYRCGSRVAAIQPAPAPAPATERRPRRRA